MNKVSVCILLILACVGEVFSGQNSGVNSTVIHHLLDVTGELDLLETIGSAFDAKNKLPTFLGSEEEAQRFIKAGNDAFDPKLLVPTVESVLIKELTPAAVSELVAWYGTPLGKRLTEVEKTARKRDLSESRRFFETRRQSPPDDARMELIRDMDKYLGHSSQMLELQKAMGRGMATGFVASNPNSPTAMSGLATLRESVTKMQIESSLLDDLFRYRSLSDDELREFLSFLKTESSQSFHKALTKARVQAWKEAGERLGKRMPVGYPRRP
jgi:hypothetical protein